eukprot:PhM_4_TR11830/c0_g1_i1/m.62896/K13251/SSR3; translocon-associated protein subunit gamma
MVSKRRMEEEDDRILNERINEQKVKGHPGLFFCSGLVTALLPTYLYCAVMNLDYTDSINLGMLGALPLIAAFCLTRAYGITYVSEYTKCLSASGVEGKNVPALQQLRMQCALSWTLFFVNSLFLGLALFFQLYVLRRLDTRVNFVVTFAVSSVLVWVICAKNEEARQRRLLRKQ